MTQASAMSAVLVLNQRAVMGLRADVAQIKVATGPTGPRGPIGQQGATGRGVKGTEITKAGDLIVNYDDGGSENVGRVLGKNGAIVGASGIDETRAIELIRGHSGGGGAAAYYVGPLNGYTVEIDSGTHGLARITGCVVQDGDGYEVDVAFRLVGTTVTIESSVVLDGFTVILS